MKKLFDSYEKVIEFAIGQEIKASRLYMDLAKKMIAPEVSELCKDLAKEELEHKGRLEKEIGKNSELESGVNLSKYNILKSDVNIFKSRIEMFMFAMKKEQASIQLYLDLAKVVNDEESRRMFVWLAEEETEHKRRFGSEYNECLK